MAAAINGMAETRIFKRNMIRYPLADKPVETRRAYGWRSVNKTPYRRVDDGADLTSRSNGRLGEAKSRHPWKSRAGILDSIFKQPAACRHGLAIPRPMCPGDA
jgi:hypothetical protein